MNQLMTLADELEAAVADIGGDAKAAVFDIVSRMLELFIPDCGERRADPQQAPPEGEIRTVANRLRRAARQGQGQ